MSRLTVGSEATGANSFGWARTTLPGSHHPNAIATTRSRTVLPSSWTDGAARHGANPSERTFASPLTPAVASSIDARLGQRGGQKCPWAACRPSSDFPIDWRTSALTEESPTG